MLSYQWLQLFQQAINDIKSIFEKHEQLQISLTKNFD